MVDHIRRAHETFVDRLFGGTSAPTQQRVENGCLLCTFDCASSEKMLDHIRGSHGVHGGNLPPQEDE